MQRSWFNEHCAYERPPARECRYCEHSKSLLDNPTEVLCSGNRLVEAADMKDCFQPKLIPQNFTKQREAKPRLALLHSLLRR